jgi:DUF1680 family protein
MKRSTLIALLGLALATATNVPAGELTARMNLALDRIRHGGPPEFTDAFILADAVPRHERRFTEFSGDVSGRYLGALAVVAQQEGRAIPELDRVITELVKLQKPDGHFGDPFSKGAVTKSDMALLWGNGRLLIGLLEYHHFKPSERVLACARKLGDCFVALGPRLNDPKVLAEFSGDQIAVGYICWTQIIEGLVELHRVTHDNRYLGLAEEIASNTHRHPKQHSHGFVTALRGIVELYRTTRDAKWLAKAETEWEGILASGNLLPHGALPEVFKPLIKRDEGCSEADWLRFNLALWAETRKARYLENAELTLFNEFFFNQFHGGDFGSRHITADGIGPGAARAWWCCTFHGLRAFPEVLQGAFRADAAALCYDLPVDGEGSVSGLTVRAESALAHDATVTLSVRECDEREHVLRIRKPAWASAVVVTLRRQPLAAVTNAAVVELKRRWERSDNLTVTYTLTTRVLQDVQHPGRVAFLHGPWFLGVNEETAPTFFDEPYQQNRVMVPAATNGVICLQPAADRFTRRGPFVASAAHLTLPYLPGGYPCQPQTVTLRPIAEQTHLGDATPWQLWFEPKK